MSSGVMEASLLRQRDMFRGGREGGKGERERIFLVECEFE